MKCLSPVRSRTAVVDPATIPALPNPASDPAHHIRTTLPTNASTRTVTEIAGDHSRAIAEADQLQTKSRSAALSVEDSARLGNLVDTAERLAVELDQARIDERLAAQRLRTQAPTRPAIAPATPSANSGIDSVDHAEGMQIWVRSVAGDAGIGADQHYRARKAGFTAGAKSVSLPCDFGGTLNTRKRTMNKAGVGIGKELMPITYSDKLTEYLTFFSTLVGLVDSETTGDGNDRDYFKIDDTGLISSYTNAGGGTEVNPTIPDKDVATGSKRIKARTITSGYHKITREAMRDSAVMMNDKVAKAIGNSHARKIEREIVLGGGDGVDEAEGIATAATQFGVAVADISADLFDDLYFNVPEQYRDACIWLVSPMAQARMRKKFKDTTGRTLFTDAIEGDRRVVRYGGLPVVSSTNMPGWVPNAVPIILVNPLFYMLRLVDGQTIDLLTEKFHPHLAYSGSMAIGGAWLGPALACQSLKLTATPAA